MTVDIHEAKTHLSRLVAAVLAGEEVILARDGKPVARLVPWENAASIVRPAGMHAGPVGPDFEARSMAPLTGEELKDWGL